MNNHVPSTTRRRPKGAMARCCAVVPPGRDDLEPAPFDAHGGLGRTWQLFREHMDRIIDEMNEAPTA